MSNERINSVLYLSTHQSGGGAAVACNNLYVAMSENVPVSDLVSLQLDHSIQHKLVYFSNIVIDRIVRKFLFQSNPIFHSSGLCGVLDANTILREGYDIIHGHWVSNGLIGLDQLSRLTDFLVLTMHDSWFASGFEHHPNGIEFSNTRFDKYLFRKKKDIVSSCAGVVFPSAWQMEIFQSRIDKMPMSRVIPNIVNVVQEDQYSSSLDSDNLHTNKHFVIGVCCQRAFENPAKGSDRLKGLLKYLNEKYKDGSVALYIAGKGSRNIDYIRSIFPRIFIKELGVLPNSDIYKFYKSIDLFLNLSTIENLSTTLIESLGYSTPSVALNVGGNAEIVVDNETGVLVNDSASLNDTVVDLIENRSKLLVFGKNSYDRYLSIFSPEAVVAAHLDFYRNTIN